MEQKISPAVFVIHNRHVFGIQSPMGANLQKRHLIVLLDNILIIVGVGLVLMNIPILLHTALAKALVTKRAVIPGLMFTIQILAPHNVHSLIRHTVTTQRHGDAISPTVHAHPQIDVVVKPPKAPAPAQTHTAQQDAHGKIINVFLAVRVITSQIKTFVTM